MFSISKDFCPHDKPQCPRKAWFVLGLVLTLAALGGLAYHKITPVVAPASTVATNNLNDIYQQLLKDPKSIGGNWLRTLNPALQDVQGDLVWNTEQQRGVMRFVNLPDPAKDKLYKVWIYDSRRPANSPVLGASLSKGSARQELFAVISADETVADPYKFVLTQEAANGFGEATILLMVQP